jgi:hypothetical protein
MDELCRVQISQSSQYLAADKSNVGGLKDLLSHKRMEVCFYQFEYEIQIFIVLCPYCLVQFDYVRVVKLS